jgi:hypothetical protein
MVLEDPGGSSRKVQGVVAALNELERFHSGEASLQTAHYLTVIRCSWAPGMHSHLIHYASVVVGIIKYYPTRSTPVPECYCPCCGSRGLTRYSDIYTRARLDIYIQNLMWRGVPKSFPRGLESIL